MSNIVILDYYRHHSSSSFVVDWCVCCMRMYFSVNLMLRLEIISKNRSECRLFTEIFNSTNVRCCCFSLYNFKRKCNKTTAESTMRERHICEHQNWKFINRKLETTNDKEYECREKTKWKNLRMKGARNYFKTVWLLTVEHNHFGLYDFQFQCLALLFYLCRHFFMHLIQRSQRLILHASTIITCACAVHFYGLLSATLSEIETKQPKFFIENCLSFS